MVARDSQRFKAVDDLPVEPSLGFDGATGKAVQRHQRRLLRFGQRRRVRKTMRLMHLKAHMLVLGRNPEGSHKRSVNRIDERGLFLARPLAADLDERPRHGVPFRIGRAMLSARDRVMHPISLPSAHLPSARQQSRVSVAYVATCAASAGCGGHGSRVR